MRYLFFDTETTGVPKNFKAPITDVNNWPRVIQIAWMRYEDSVLEQAETFLVKPDGFIIPADAVAVHGITTEKAAAEGRPIKEVLGAFVAAMGEQGSIIVGHNLPYDANVVGAELVRLGLPNYFTAHRGICTMKRSTEFCKIPGPYGYKWPKLQELYRKLFSEDFENAHDAMADIRATSRCFFELKKRGIID